MEVSNNWHPPSYRPLKCYDPYFRCSSQIRDASFGNLHVGLAQATRKSTRSQCRGLGTSVCWVAVKELNLSYYIGETLLFTIYTQYGNSILSSLTATQFGAGGLLESVRNPWGPQGSECKNAER